MELGAKAAPKQTYFDEAERDRIRRALLRYMQDNRIGVPTLQRAIAKAHSIVEDRIPQKSLQRFLGNTHRTNDMLVRFCFDFIERQAATDDPLDLYGAQLAAFHSPRTAEDDAAAPAPLLALEDCSGTFEGIVPVRAKGLALHDPANKTKLSDLTLTPSPSGPFVRAGEAVANWRAAAVPVPEGSPRRAYEGVAVVTATGLLVALRSTLTGAPRTYWLMADPEGLAGQGAEPAGSLDRDPPSVFDRLALEKITFRRVEAKPDG